MANVETKDQSLGKTNLQKSKKLKWIMGLTLLSCLVAFWWLGLDKYLSFEFLKAQQQSFEEFYHNHTWLTLTVYFLIYVIVTALSLPGAAVMTLAGGFLFGLFVGTIVVSFASTLGATLAFLVARFLLRDYVQSQFSEKLKTINEGIRKEGVFYLFTLRLIPAVPFFIINLVMGLTPIRTLQFFVVSQIGMLPGTIVYVNAGTQLSELESLGGILSLELILSFVALGLFPFFAKKIITLINKKPKNAAQ